MNIRTVCHRKSCRTSRRARRGTAYTLVLAVSLLVVVMALAGLMSARVRLRMAAQTDGWNEARVLALSAMEHALAVIDEAVEAERESGGTWRDAFVHGAPVDPVPLGAGSFTWTVLDATGDEDLSDDPTEPVRIVATGNVGPTTHRLAVELSPSRGRTPVGCLDRALHAGGRLDLPYAHLTGDRTVGTNDIASATAADVYADVEAVSSVVGSVYHGTTQSGVAWRTMPESDALEHYVGVGTAINVIALPLEEGFRNLQRVLLSPAHNPFGSTDPLGVYVIDCAGAPLRVRDCRIVGTLVLLNAGPGTRVTGRVNWEPAVTNYPALLVSGDLAVSFDDWLLDESATSVNFNPPGTPYREQTDADVTDSYQSVLAGLVYATGNIVFDGSGPAIEGVVIAGGNVTVDASRVTLLYRDTFTLDPPPGFERLDGPPSVIRGSWVQVVD